MEKNFIEFNGVLINVRYIKKIYKTENSRVRTINNNTELSKYYEIRVNVDGTPGTHVETYFDEKERDIRFNGLSTLLLPND